MAQTLQKKNAQAEKNMYFCKCNFTEISKLIKILSVYSTKKE